jgi:hypothetical protein
MAARSEAPAVEADGDADVATSAPAAAAAGANNDGEPKDGDATPPAAGAPDGVAPAPLAAGASVRVIRRSNIRARPTPQSTSLGRVEVGTVVRLVEAEPVRGYYRIAVEDREGWIWGANVTAETPADDRVVPVAPPASQLPPDEPAPPEAAPGR